MVSGSGELQREVKEGRCWGGVGRVRGDGRHGRVMGSIGTSALMAAGMLGDKACDSSCICNARHIFC
jgi:hypothetical protein